MWGGVGSGNLEIRNAKFGKRPAVAGSRMCGKIRNAESEIRKGGIWSVEGATGKVRG